MSNIRWFTDSVCVEQEAVAQVRQTASMPFVRGVAVMPDVHYGKGSTVGTVVATKGAIMPACVGVDIGCGMIAVRTKLPPEALVGKEAVIRKGIERRVPVGIGLHGMNSRILPSAKARIAELEAMAEKLFDDKNHMDQRAKDWRTQLGTLGGGNHFIEVCKGRPINHTSELDGFNYPSSNGEVWVILHSGSRGVGNKTGTYWTGVARKQSEKYMYDQWLPNPDLAYLVEHSEEFWKYMNELNWCQRYAFLNRETMMEHVLLELAYTAGGYIGAWGADDIVCERINCHHNYVAKEHHDGENVWVTRKGAIYAVVGSRGLIPGSMGACSYIVTGKGHSGAYLSAPHGAGRKMSRTRARACFTVESVSAELAAKGIEARVREQIVDEAPGAYKDIDMVMWDARELVQPTDMLSQIISVKGD